MILSMSTLFPSKGNGVVGHLVTTRPLVRTKWPLDRSLLAVQTEKMLKIDVQTNLSEALKPLAAIDKAKWPEILRHATTETAFYVRNKYRTELPKYIDRPTKYTLESMFVKRGTRADPEATVQWKDWAGGGAVPAGRYLQPEVYGGPRHQKRFERALISSGFMPAGYVAVPTEDAPKDSHGNVSGNFIKQILNYLKANPESMEKAQVKRLKNMKTSKLVRGIFKTATNFDKAKRREEKADKKKRAKFAVITKGVNGTRLPSGIYERVKTSLPMGAGGPVGGQGRATMRRIFTFVPVATYKATIPFQEIGAKAASEKFPSKLDEAIQLSLNRG